MYSHCYLGLHVRAAGVGGEGSEVAQGLGLLLQRHDAVLLEHPRTSPVSPLAHHQLELQLDLFNPNLLMCY